MIFDGKKFQAERVQILRKKLVDLKLKQGRVLSLASLYFSTDQASQTYTRLKEKLAEKLGIRFIKFGIDIESGDDLNKINQLIKLEAGKVDGVLIQKPSKIMTIPDRHRDEVFYQLAASVPVEKDVDVISPKSLGRLVMINESLKFLWPATVRAVFWVLAVALKVYQHQVNNPFELISETQILVGKKIVVVGNRGLVGSVLSLALASFGAQVVGGDKGVDVEVLVREGEIVISCTGVPGLIKSDWIRPSQTIVDVGFGKKEGRVVGDFEKATYEKVKFSAGVPGGVGPITVISLMENLLQLFVSQNQRINRI